MSCPAAGGSLTDVGEVRYDDGSLVLDDQGLTIRRYYFPCAGDKRLWYRDVRRVEVRAMNWLTGKGRLWGTADPRYWLPLDPRRPRKSTLLCFDVGRGIKPCVSPGDPERVIDWLQGRVPIARKTPDLGAG